MISVLRWQSLTTGSQARQSESTHELPGAGGAGGGGLEQADEAVRGCCGPTAGKMPWAGRGREEEEDVRKEGT